MAFVLPIIAAVGTVGSAMTALGAGATVAAGIGAAVSTVGGFLSVAGGVLAGVGALTGKKDLIKLGGLFSLGSAAAGALGVGGASTGIGGAAGATEGGAAIAGDGLQASQMTEGIKGFGDTAALKEGAANYSLGSGGSGQGLLMQKAQQFATQAAQPTSLVADAGGLTAGTGGGSLAGVQAPGLTPTVSAPTDYTLASAVQGAKPLPASAAGITQNDLQSVLSKGWQRAQEMLKNTGQFVKENKELAMIGGQALSSMYGPQAEQFDYQRSIMDRINRNLNSPVRLGNVTPGG